jgi:hypothetical protein
MRSEDIVAKMFKLNSGRRKTLRAHIPNLSEKREIAITQISALLREDSNMSREQSIEFATRVLNSYLAANMQSPSERVH